MVATDDERIYDTVLAFGGRAEMTSPDHKSGTDRCWEAYLKQGKTYDVVVNVQGDEPFIRASQLEAVKRCFDDPATDIATLVRPFAATDGLEALENPNSPKVVLDAQSRALYFSRSVIPYLRGVERFGHSVLPMDEALVLCAVDLSGRCTLNWDIRCQTEKVGDFDVECAKEFWYGFARSVPATVHFVQFAGENTHHILEACFKGAGHALAEAVRIDAAHRDEIPSTKGLLV